MTGSGSIRPHELISQIYCPDSNRLAHLCGPTAASKVCLRRLRRQHYLLGRQGWHAVKMPESADPFTCINVRHVALANDAGNTAIITLARPEKLNAMNAILVEELHQALDAVNDEPDTRAVIITGDGRGFCAGLDLTGYGLLEGSASYGRVPNGMRVQQHIATLATKLRGLSKPVIAAVNGAAAGGGLAIALASDVRIAATSAKFNVAFVRIGLSGCDIGVSWMLPRLIGASRAFELLLSGRIIDSVEADRIGLVTKVVPDAELLDSAIAMAQSFAANSPMGVWMTKEVMWSQLEIPSMQAGIDLENRTQIMLSQTEDHREAMRAFLEKRTPNFGFK